MGEHKQHSFDSNSQNHAKIETQSRRPITAGITEYIWKIGKDVWNIIGRKIWIWGGFTTIDQWETLKQEIWKSAELVKKWKFGQLDLVLEFVNTLVIALDKGLNLNTDVQNWLFIILIHFWVKISSPLPHP